MKNFLNRFIACACSVGLALSTAMTANAEDDETFPSGKKPVALEKLLDSIYNDDTFESPAISYVFFHGDKTLVDFAGGYTDLENHVPTDENTVYDWGSVTKTLVWVSVFQLWEQGKIDLDADIQTYLPDGFFQHLSYDDPITMTNLMNHTGGWCESIYGMFMDMGDEDKIPELGQALQDNEPAQAYRPGEVTAYSNWGAALAGYIVERISGISFTEYVHKNIFEPLGMEHTAISVDMRDNQWVREQRMKIKTYEYKVTPVPKYYPKKKIMEYIVFYPCGSAVGTITDFATYAKALVNADAPLFKNKETQEKLFSGSEFYGNSDIPSCSYGFWVNDTETARLYSHNGCTGWHNANMVFDIVSGYGFVSLTADSDGCNDYYDYVFGEQNEKDYPAIDDEKTDVSGDYLLARSYAKGILKTASLLYSTQTVELTVVENSVSGFEEHELEERHVGDNAYMFVDTDNGVIFGTASIKNYSDGRKGMNMNGQDMILEKHYTLKIVFLTLYFLVAFASLFALMIKFKLKKAHRLSTGAGTIITSSAQICSLISVVALIVPTSLLFAEDTNIVSRSFMAVFGSIQIICMAFSVASAVVSAYSLISKKNSKFQIISNIACILGNIITTSAILYFEMYQFWGC